VAGARRPADHPRDDACMTETAEAEPSGDADVVILIPLYNDWASLRLLLIDLDDVLAHASLRARVLVVDDGSTVEPEGGAWGPYRTLGPIEVVHLRRNLGHQRAIAVGLPYIEERIPCRAVVLMDSDGEDAPSDVPRLLARFEEEGGRRIVFAERARRSESPTFIVFYNLYKWAHLALTGIGVRVGNFSVIPRRRLESLVVVSELWSHYAAAVFKSRQPFCSVPTHRATRLAGKPQMNFVRLVVHGLSAISVFSDIIGVRLLVATMILTLLCMVGIGATIGVRLFTTLAIPGWATMLIGILLIVLLQAIMFSILFSFLILGDRQATTFLPRRDYSPFVGDTTTLGPRP
jgi:hypothetical protein